MSTSVKLGLGLLASKGILPKEEMIKVFNNCLDELEYHIVNDKLILNDKIVGILSIKERIIVSVSSHQVESQMNNIEKIRSLFALKAEVAQKNYLKERKEQIELQNNNSAVFEKIKKEIDLEQLNMEKALLRQKKESCDALKEELIESAVNNGYEVEVIDNKSNQVQLQLIRREY